MENDNNIESHLIEKRVFKPAKNFARSSWIFAAMESKTDWSTPSGLSSIHSVVFFKTMLSIPGW